MGLNWSAGAATAELAVPNGTTLAGYGGRTSPSRGTLRPLEVNVLVVAAGASTAVIVSLDLLSIDASWVGSLRDRLRVEDGIPPELVLVAASHTHSGPVGFRLVGAPGQFDTRTSQLRQDILDTVTSAIRAALRDIAPAQIRIASGTCDVGAHRHDAAKPVDQCLTRVDVLREGQPIALLWHYACHATVLAADNTLVSADLPGEVRARLRERSGGTLPVLYLNGAAADVSTRFTRRSQTPVELDRLAQILDAAMPDTGRILTSATPVGRLATCPLPVAVDEHAALAARLRNARDAYDAAVGFKDPAQLRVLATAVLGLEKRLARCADSRVGAPSELTATIQLIHLGDLALVGIPGELYSEQGKQIRDHGSRLFVLPVGYAGDYLGYFPPLGEVAGYEADSAFVAAGAGDLLAETAINLLSVGVRP